MSQFSWTVCDSGLLLKRRVVRKHFDDSVAYNLTVRSFQSISGKLESPTIRNTAFLNSVCKFCKELASRSMLIWAEFGRL